MYNSPTKVQDAEDKLHNYKQGTDSLAMYIVKFKRLLYKACCQAWLDYTKIISFCNGLNSVICGRLNNQLLLLLTYSKYIHTV